MAVAYESELVPLAVLAGPDKVVQVPFAALYLHDMTDEIVTVTAVLSRTCVYYSGIGEFGGQDRKLARLSDVWVEAGRLEVRPLGRNELAALRARMKGQGASKLRVSGGDFS